MASDTFSKLTMLKKIWLNFNKCINVNLEGETKLATLPGLIAARCENSTDIQADCSLNSSQLLKLEAELKIVTEKNSELEAEKVQCQNKIKQIWELHQLWEKRWDATFAFKMGELKDELKLKKAEIDEKDSKIKKLKEQVEFLSSNRSPN